MKIYKQYIPVSVVFLYIAVNVYLIALNWNVFSTVLNIDLGFGTVAMAPFLFLFVFGLVLMLGLWFYEYRKDLKNQILFLENDSKIHLLEKDMEIESLKAKAHQVQNQMKEVVGFEVKENKKEEALQVVKEEKT